MNIFELDRVLTRVFAPDGLISHQILNIKELMLALEKKHIKKASVLCFSKKNAAKWIPVKGVKEFRRYGQRFHYRQNRVYGIFLHNASYNTTTFRFNQYAFMFANSHENRQFDRLILSLYASPNADKYLVDVTHRSRRYDIDLEGYLDICKKKHTVNGLKYEGKYIDYDWIYRDINDLLRDYRDNSIFILDFLTMSDIFANTEMFISHLCSSPIDVTPMLIEDNKMLVPMSFNWFFYLMYGYKYNVVSRIIHRNKNYSIRGVEAYSEVSLCSENKDISRFYKIMWRRMSYSLTLDEAKYKPVFFEYYNNIPFIREKYVGNYNSSKTKSEEGSILSSEI